MKSACKSSHCFFSPECILFYAHDLKLFHSTKWNNSYCGILFKLPPQLKHEPSYMQITKLNQCKNKKACKISKSAQHIQGRVFLPVSRLWEWGGEIRDCDHFLPLFQRILRCQDMATFSVEALYNNYCNWGQIGQRLASGSTQDCCETPVHLEWSSDFHVPARHHRSPAWAAGYALKPARPKSLLHLMPGPRQQGQEHHESCVAAQFTHPHSEQTAQTHPILMERAISARLCQETRASFKLLHFGQPIPHGAGKQRPKATSRQGWFQRDSMHPWARDTGRGWAIYLPFVPNHQVSHSKFTPP